MPAGALYVVSTPIGNLGDVTVRAIETLKKVDWIACEDTRHTGLFLAHYGIRKSLVSYYDAVERKKAPELAERLALGESGALVSDAGTPGVADPGYRLVAAALAAGARVEALPGPAAFLAALTVSGLPTDRFGFEGFAPVKKGERGRWLARLAKEDRTVIFYESPHRILSTLESMKEALGPETPIVVARELTKKFEEVLRGPVSGVLERLKSGRVRGEFVVLFHPQAPGR